MVYLLKTAIPMFIFCALKLFCLLIIINFIERTQCFLLWCHCCVALLNLLITWWNKLIRIGHMKKWVVNKSQESFAVFKFMTYFPNHSIDLVWGGSIPSTPDFFPQLSSTKIISTARLAWFLKKHVNIFFLFNLLVPLTLSEMSMKSVGEFLITILLP